MKKMVYAKLDATLKEMKKLNDETKAEIKGDVNLVRDEMNAQFTKITSLI